MIENAVSIQMIKMLVRKLWGAERFPLSKPSLWFSISRFLAATFVVAIAVLPRLAFCKSPSLNAASGYDFEGSWTCSEQFQESGATNRSVYRGELRAGGRWLELSALSVEPEGNVSHLELGVDKNGTGLILVDTSSAGYAIFGGRGWNGKSMTLSERYGRSSATAETGRFVYSLSDPTHFDLRHQNNSAGQWVVDELFRCEKAASAQSARYLSHPFESGETFKTIFSRTISFKATGMDDLVRRFSGTADMRVTKVEPDDVHFSTSYRYDGMAGGEGTGESEHKDSGRLVCVKSVCVTPTDGSGTLLNPLLWGSPPESIYPGTMWAVRIDRPWELGPAGDQTITVLSVDSTTDTVFLKREGTGNGFFDSESKELHITRGDKSFLVDVAPGSAHWIGQTVVRHGVIMSDELLVERAVTLSSAEVGSISATERQYILLNAAP